MGFRETLSWPRLWAVLVGWGFLVALARAAEFSDQPEDRQVLTDDAGIIEGSNVGASVQPGEPLHGGKRGGHSMWISWKAPKTGVVTFNTEGSTFDTLLSVYLTGLLPGGGPFFQQLITEASNDDSDDKQTARVQVGVTEGRTYTIAIDGYAGATGTIRLGWKLRPFKDPFPVKFSRSNDSAYKLGASFPITAVVQEALGGSYQWYFNGAMIPGATSPTWIVDDFQAVQAGVYKMQYTNDDLVWFSEPIEIQSNDEGDSLVLARDKMQDVMSVAGQPPLGAVAGVASTRHVGLHDGVSRGYKGTQIFSTAFGLRDAEEPKHCGVEGGASYWLPYRAPASGKLQINTDGSRFDTLLAVYTYTVPLKGYGDLRSLGCDNDSGPNGTSQLEVSVEAGVDYLVVVDGVNGARGLAFLNYELKTTDVPGAPSIQLQPLAQEVGFGKPFRLTIAATGDVPLFYQWYLNGRALVGETNPVVSRDVAKPKDVGLYEVRVQNVRSVVSSVSARVQLLVAAQIQVDRKLGLLQLRTAARPGISFSLERSSSLAEEGWNRVTNGVSLSDEVIVNPPESSAGSGFFRFRIW